MGVNLLSTPVWVLGSVASSLSLSEDILDSTAAVMLKEISVQSVLCLTRMSDGL